MGSLSAYGPTAGAVHSLGYHLVGRLRYRRPVLDGRVADRLRELIRAKGLERGWSVEALKVVPGHVPLLARCGPDATPARLAHQLKGATSRAPRAELPRLRSRLPTLRSRSYLVALVGRVSAATVGRYIAVQTTRPTKALP
jgi:putative transposase